MLKNAVLINFLACSLVLYKQGVRVDKPKPVILKVWPQEQQQQWQCHLETC